MAKAIRFTFKDEEYVLQFTKRTIKEMEDKGFRIREIGDRPMTLWPMLFKGAFLANHRSTKESAIEEIYDAMPNKQALVEAMIELYDEPYSAMMDDPSETDPNVNWTLS